MEAWHLPRAKATMARPTNNNIQVAQEVTIARLLKASNNGHSKVAMETTMVIKAEISH
jgi:hypothetical protein